MTTQHATSHLPTSVSLAQRSAPRLRLGLAVALVTACSALAALIAGHALFGPAPTACGEGCGLALASGAAVVLGVPALAWAGTLHVLLFTTTWATALVTDRSTQLRPALHNAQLALMVVLLMGSATYLVLGLATGVRCPICLAMHGLAVGASLGVALLPRPEDALAPVQRWAALALALSAWTGLAWGAGHLAARARAARAAPAASTDKWLAAVCEPTTCPAAARFGPEALPDDDGALALAPGEPTLVAWLDLDCPACRSDFAAEAPLFADLVAGRARALPGPGLRLVLRSSCTERGGDQRACEAPAAVICAGRHGGGAAALAQLGWELAAAPGYYTRADRRQALAEISEVAARCLDSELALGPRGTLAAHAEAARRLAASARTHAGCGGADDAWWCFAATPSFAIVHASTPIAPRAPVDAFSGATGELRREVLERCLEVSP